MPCTTNPRPTSPCPRRLPKRACASAASTSRGRSRGAFAVEPLRRGEIEGRRIALVDDVLTTGATAAEMARTLLAAGAASVHLWVLARTPAPGSA